MKIEKFLAKHEVSHRCLWVVGSAAAEIVAAGQRERVQMIVMDAHGHGLVEPHVHG